MQTPRAFGKVEQPVPNFCWANRRATTGRSNTRASSELEQPEGFIMEQFCSLEHTLLHIARTSLVGYGQGAEEHFG